MYLAKFFHRPPGDERPRVDPHARRRSLSLIGVHHVMQPDGTQERRFPAAEGFFSDIGIAVAAFLGPPCRRELVTSGYMGNRPTPPTTRSAICCRIRKPKPDWQKGPRRADAGGVERAARRAGPSIWRRSGTRRRRPASRSYLWLAAHHAYGRTKYHEFGGYGGYQPRCQARLADYVTRRKAPIENPTRAGAGTSRSR